MGLDTSSLVIVQQACRDRFCINRVRSFGTATVFFPRVERPMLRHADTYCIMNIQNAIFLESTGLMLIELEVHLSLTWYQDSSMS